MLRCGVLGYRYNMSHPTIPNLLQLPTQKLLDEFGAGRHKPGSGSAAALLGLVACKMMQTVITVTRRNPQPQYVANMSQLDFVESKLKERDEPFFRDAVQRDSEQFDRYFKALAAKRAAPSDAEKSRLAELARQELVPTTEIPLGIARQAVETAERGLAVFDLGVRHARGDSGVAVSSALSSCSGALFIVYLNLLSSREGRWAVATRAEADRIAERYHVLQIEQFKRVSRIQAEGVPDAQIEMQLSLGLADDDNEPA
jgi:formiminotetrahydrofolate cyclodeaminase